MMPIGNWDQYAERRVPVSGDDGRYWPLLTLYGDANNWIEFAADCINRAYRVRLKAGSGAATTYPIATGKLLWLPDSPLYVALAFNRNANRLYIGGSLGGDVVRTYPDTGSTRGIDVTSLWSSQSFTELRFRGAPDTVSNSEVNEFRWFGGDVQTGGSYDDASVTSAFEDISFLSWVP